MKEQRKKEMVGRTLNGAHLSDWTLWTRRAVEDGQSSNSCTDGHKIVCVRTAIMLAWSKHTQGLLPEIIMCN